MRILRYLRIDLLPLRQLFLIFLFNVLFIAAIAEPTPSLDIPAECNEINASFEVTSSGDRGLNNSILLDIKDVERTSLIVSLVGPKKLFLRDIKENEIKNLHKGTYSLVIVSRDESSGYCPKHFQVIIK